MKQDSKNKQGMTLVEIQLAVLLLGVISLTIFALYNASRVLYLAADSKVIISYELQYAVEHIYKNAMRAIGDKSSPAIEVSADNQTLYLNINNNDPLTKDNYSSGMTTYTYTKSSTALNFSTNGTTWESLVPKISIETVNFDLATQVLTISLEGRYRDKTLTFYSACYPRLASFQ